MNINIREMETEDCKEIVIIYNDALDERIATFNTEHIDADTVLKWSDKGAILVATSNENVIGFVRSYPYSERLCYLGIAEFSIYVSSKQRGKGVGGRLISDFLEVLISEGKWKVLSRVFPENRPSLSLLIKHGFREVGTYRNHATLNGVWRDVVIVERLLGKSVK